MLRVFDVFHSGHLHHPQGRGTECCAAGVVISTCGWEEIREQLAREGSHSKALRFPRDKRIFCPLPLVPPAFGILTVTFLTKGGSFSHCRSGKMLDSQKGACSVDMLEPLRAACPPSAKGKFHKPL